MSSDFSVPYFKKAKPPPCFQIFSNCLMMPWNGSPFTLGYFVNDNHLFSTYMLGFVTYDCFGGIFLSNLENITYCNYYEVSYLRDKDSKAKCGYLKPVSGKAKF